MVIHSGCNRIIYLNHFMISLQRCLEMQQPVAL